MYIQSIAVTVILILGSQHISAEFSGRAFEQAKEVDTKCRAETGAGTRYFTKFINGEIEDEDMPKYKCYLKCVMRELSALSEEGVYDIEEERKNIPPEVLEEGHRIINKCKDTVGADPCDTAFQLHKCYHDANPDLYRRALHHWENLATA